jgi:hypothetical protein
MSRGLGKIEQALKRESDDNPAYLLNLHQFACRFYGIQDSGRKVERKHKVAVLRAARSLSEKLGYAVGYAVTVQTFDDGATVEWRGLHLGQPGEDLMKARENRVTLKQVGDQVGLHASGVSRLLGHTTIDGVRVAIQVPVPAIKEGEQVMVAPKQAAAFARIHLKERERMRRKRELEDKQEQRRAKERAKQDAWQQKRNQAYPLKP